MMSIPLSWGRAFVITFSGYGECPFSFIFLTSDRPCLFPFGLCQTLFFLISRNIFSVFLHPPPTSSHALLLFWDHLLVYPFSFFLPESPLDSCHFPKYLLFYVWVQAVASTACYLVGSVYLLSRALVFSSSSSNDLLSLIIRRNL